jgi:hypothetical protein
VLLALAVQYYGSRNGSLALPYSEAHSLGISTQAQLYSGLKLLESVDLILCTRRGNLQGGLKLPSLYALTWKPVNEPASGVVYNGAITLTLKPSHAWARWTRPEDWEEQMRTITARARGQLNRACPYTKKSNTQREERAAHSVRRRATRSRSQREEQETTNPAHSVCVTSEISAQGAASDAWDLALRVRNPALQLTAVAWLLIASVANPMTTFSMSRLVTLCHDDSPSPHRTFAETSRSPS